MSGSCGSRPRTTSGVASAHVGGTPGWKARRGICPVCGRDVATGPDYRRSTDPLAGMFRLIKRHGSPKCAGVGRSVRAEKTWDVK